MDSTHAAIILSLLESATDGIWPRVAENILERGYTPDEVIAAWKSLEKSAGMSGTAPELADFS